ncbi:MAG TPA: tyrosine/phenylalanine carboxypeptidase domain-containing protein [Polyangiaceae bacterium]
MTLRRRHPLSEATASLAKQLQRCEAAIALLDRARPINLQAQLARLLAAFTVGTRPKLELEYDPPPRLAEVRQALDALPGVVDTGDTEQRLLLERAEELALEAQLAEHVGQPKFRELAAQRYPIPEQHAELRRAALERLATSQAVGPPERLHASDDERDPDSLFCLISQLISAERLPVRVELDAGLVALAAVAEGVVRVRAGAKMPRSVGRRIALHEVGGHLAPRISGATLGGLFAAAAARASDDEEGRATLLEERAGLLSEERREELARRYLVATSVREGADFWQSVDVLLASGAEPAPALELACRAHRGGGLGRELVYWSGYQRVKTALAARPELEALQRAGRISLAAAAELLTASVALEDHRNVS